MPVQKGDVLLIPSDIDNSHRVTPKWLQMYSEKSANYYVMVAKNRSQSDAEVAFFIAAEWYEGSGDAAQHIARVAQKNADGFYQLTVDDKCQYGQRNKEGAMRFVVYHDKSRKPYQHRFLEASIASLAADVSERIAGLLPGYIGVTGASKYICTGFVGDYLFTF